MKFDVRKLGIDPDAYDILKVFDCPESVSVADQAGKLPTPDLISAPSPPIKNESKSQAQAKSP